MNRYDRWLRVALEAADKATTLLQSQWRQEHAVTVKGFRDIVTEMDVKCETLILDHLRDAFPNHAMTSEEAGADTDEANVRWMVDPIDGTTNFSHNNPNFCTSIAAVENGQPVVGVIAEPLRGYVFAARRDGGATFNGSPMHVSDVTALEAAVFAVDSPRDPEKRAAMWQYLGVLLTNGRTMRASGSAALNMAYIAAGWVDFYMHLTLYPWDQAAAGLLVQEAGGVVSTVSGNSWTPYCRDPLMASSPALLDEFRAFVAEAGL